MFLWPVYFAPLLLFLSGASAQACANANLPSDQCCNQTASSWMSNAEGQSPCEVIERIMGLCIQNFSLSQLPPQFTCATESGAAAPSPCCCSTVSYALFEACRLCQTNDETPVQGSYFSFLSKCGPNEGLAQFSSNTPHQHRLAQIGVPSFAFMVPANLNTAWDASAAFANASASSRSSSAGPAQDVPPGSSTPSGPSITAAPISPSSGSSSSSQPGGVNVTVVIVVTLVCALLLIGTLGIWMWHRRRRRIVTPFARIISPESSQRSSKRETVLDLTKQMDRPAFRDPETLGPAVPWANSPVLRAFPAAVRNCSPDPRVSPLPPPPAAASPPPHQHRRSPDQRREPVTAPPPAHVQDKRRRPEQRRETLPLSPVGREREPRQPPLAHAPPKPFKLQAPPPPRNERPRAEPRPRSARSSVSSMAGADGAGVAPSAQFLGGTRAADVRPLRDLWKQERARRQ